MRIRFLIFIVCMLGVLSVSSVAQADTATEIEKQLNATAGAQGADIGEPVDPRSIVVTTIKVLLTMVGTVLFVLNIYAGFLWMTAQGNDEQIAQAKTTIRNATLGLIIVVSSYAITLAATNLAKGNPLGLGAEQKTDTLEGAINGWLK